MEITATQEARRLIEERGGRIYVSVKKAACCGGLRTLATRTNVPDEAQYRSLGSDAGFELFVPHDLAQLPARLEIDAHRFPRRVEAYWNGCAWVS